MTDRLHDNPLAVRPDGEDADTREAAMGLKVSLWPGSTLNGREPADPGPPDEAHQAIERGKAFLSRGDLDLAEAELTQAIGLAAENPDAFLVRGQVFERRGDDDRALADYSAAVQLDLSQLLTFAQRLLAFTARRDFAGAVADADQSLLVNQRLCRTCFLRSALYGRRNEWALAVADYNQVLQLDPTNSLAYLRRGDAAAKLGEWARAVADFTESLRLDPHNVETLNNRGEAFVRLGQTDQALADFTAALRLDPHHASARFNRAEAHRARGEYDQAVTDFNQAVHLAPASARPYAGRALARLEKGEWDRALADLDKALLLDPHLAHAPRSAQAADRLRAGHEQVVAGVNRFKQAFRIVAEVVGTGRTDLELPELPAAETSSGLVLPPAYSRAEPVPEAVQAVPAFPRRSPDFSADPPVSDSQLMPAGKDSVLTEDDPGARQRRLAARHCRKGQMYQKEGDHDRAVAAYTSALAVDPGCVEALRERGLIHRLERRLDEALEDFNVAIEIEPGAELFFRRGVAFAERRQFKQAFADFDEAIERDPQHALAYLNRGLIEVVVGKFERAAENAERALEFDPTLTRARFLRGVAYGKMGRHDRAVDDFDEVIAQEPDNARAHNHRGLAYAAEGKHEEAIAAYDEAVRLSPTLWAAYFNRGIAFHLKGDFAGAVAAFTHFLGRKPQYAPAYHQRGLARQAIQDYDAAIADFTQAFQLDPNLTEAYTSCLEATRLKYEASSRRAESLPRALAAPVVERPLPTLPPEPVHDFPSKPSLNDTVPATIDRTAVELPRSSESFHKPTVPTGKLQLECPECGTMGLLDLRHLGKKFRCPGCHVWWRTNASGNLEEAARPEDDARAGEDSGPKSGIWKPLPATANEASPSKPEILTPVAAKPSKPVSAGTAAEEAEALLAVGAPPAKAPPEAAAPARSAAKPVATAKAVSKTLRRRKEGGLRHAAMWLSTLARTKAGRWAAVLAVVLALAAVPLLFPSLFPSELKSRGQKAATAWLAHDSEQLKTFADPGLVEHMPHWLEANQPPELVEGQEKSEVTVAVERNDGGTAEVIIQVKGTKPNGATGYYVYRHRWVQRKGTWYLQPDLPPPGTSAPAPAKPVAGKGK